LFTDVNNFDETYNKYDRLSSFLPEILERNDLCKAIITSSFGEPLVKGNYDVKKIEKGLEIIEKIEKQFHYYGMDTCAQKCFWQETENKFYIHPVLIDNAKLYADVSAAYKLVRSYFDYYAEKNDRNNFLDQSPNIKEKIQRYYEEYKLLCSIEEGALGHVKLMNDLSFLDDYFCLISSKPPPMCEHQTIEDWLSIQGVEENEV
jgi:hypothetical protein